jgi:hypothetical protein
MSNRKIKEPIFLNIGDIVTYNRRMQGHLWKVVEADYAVWTAQDAQYGYCELADVGNSHTTGVTIESVFYFNFSKRKKTPRVLRVGMWGVSKLEPQEVAEIIDKLKHFMLDTWP